jgi:hypothetical protein
LAEDHAAGASVGPFFKSVIEGQFQRLRDGDRFWYQNTFSGPALAAIQGTTLSDVIKRNTALTNVQDNPFAFDVTIRGRVLDSSGSTPVGLGGWTVQLQDELGAVLESTVTAADGSYSFGGLALGTYRVREVVQPGWTQTSADPDDIEAVQASTFAKVNFRNVPTTAAVAASTAAVSTAAPAPAMTFGTERIDIVDVLASANDSVLTT